MRALNAQPRAPQTFIITKIVFKISLKRGLQTLCTEAPPTPAHLEEDSLSLLPISPDKHEPWNYLDPEEEYQTRFGSRPAWADCLRNHKGGLLHRGRARYVLVQMKLLGNRCPFSRDHEPHVDLRNVKLWGRFVRARSGVPFLAPDTGVCAKQREKLTQAVQKAGDRGLPSYRIPQVEPRDPDLGNSHGAVSATPPGPHSDFR